MSNRSHRTSLRKGRFQLSHLLGGEVLAPVAPGPARSPAGPPFARRRLSGGTNPYLLSVQIGETPGAQRT